MSPQLAMGTFAVHDETESGGANGSIVAWITSTNPDPTCGANGANGSGGYEVWACCHDTYKKPSQGQHRRFRYEQKYNFVINAALSPEEMCRQFRQYLEEKGIHEKLDIYVHHVL